MSSIYVERLQIGFRRLNRNPRYVAPYKATGFRSLDGAREWDEPESVMGHGVHRPKRGLVDDIREVSEDAAAELARIDNERDRLQKQLAYLNQKEREILESAFNSGKPLVVASIQ